MSHPRLILKVHIDKYSSRGQPFHPEAPNFTTRCFGRSEGLSGAFMSTEFSSQLSRTGKYRVIKYITHSTNWQ